MLYYSEAIRGLPGASERERIANPRLVFVLHESHIECSFFHSSPYLSHRLGSINWRRWIQPDHYTNLKSCHILLKDDIDGKNDFSKKIKRKGRMACERIKEQFYRAGVLWWCAIMMVPLHKALNCLGSESLYQIHRAHTNANSNFRNLLSVNESRWTRVYHMKVFMTCR